MVNKVKLYNNGNLTIKNDWVEDGSKLFSITDAETITTDLREEVSMTGNNVRKDYATHTDIKGSLTVEGSSTVETMNITGSLTVNGVTDLMPIGAKLIWHDSTPPNHFLLCNGASVSRTTYASLFSVIGVIHGAGDGSTTFNLPDMRGRHLIGAGDGLSPGDTGGTLDHTHYDNDHAHTITHTHTLNGHVHTLNGHTHGLNNHSHEYSHTHNLASHTHSTNGHYHSYVSADCSTGSTSEFRSGVTTMASGSHRHANGSTQGSTAGTSPPSTANTSSASAVVGTPSTANTQGNSDNTGTPSPDLSGASSKSNSETAGYGLTGPANTPYRAIYYIVRCE